MASPSTIGFGHHHQVQGRIDDGDEDDDGAAMDCAGECCFNLESPQDDRAESRRLQWILQYPILPLTQFIAPFSGSHYTRENVANKKKIHYGEIVPKKRSVHTYVPRQRVSQL